MLIVPSISRRLMVRSVTPDSGSTDQAQSRLFGIHGSAEGEIEIAQLLESSLSGLLARPRQLPLNGRRSPTVRSFSLLDHREHLDLDHRLWLGETADLDRRAGRTGYAEVAHAHVGALRERLIVRDEGVGLDNIGPGRAGGLEAGVKVLEGLFELRPHVARADDVALCVA